MDRALADLEVTPPQFAVLTMIVAYPGVSGADLSRLTFLTPQTINVIVRNLVRAGAIEKSAHAAHGRILRLTATARGQALLRRCRSGKRARGLIVARPGTAAPAHPEPASVFRADNRKTDAGCRW